MDGYATLGAGLDSGGRDADPAAADRHTFQVQQWSLGQNFFFPSDFQTAAVFANVAAELIGDQILNYGHEAFSKLLRNELLSFWGGWLDQPPQGTTVRNALYHNNMGLRKKWKQASENRFRKSLRVCFYTGNISLACYG
jgi:hypothetical protein